MQIFKKIKKYNFNVHVCHIKGSDPAGFLKDEAQALIADGRQLAVLPLAPSLEAATPQTLTLRGN